MRRIFSTGLLAGGVALSALLAPGVAAASDGYEVTYQKYDIEAKAYREYKTPNAYGYTAKYHFYGDKYVGDTYVSCTIVKHPKQGYGYGYDKEKASYDCVAESVIYKKDKHKEGYKGYELGKVHARYSHEHGDKKVKGKIYHGEGHLYGAYGTYQVKHKKGYDKVEYKITVPVKPY